MHQCPSSIVIRVHTRQLHGETEEDEGREKKTSPKPNMATFSLLCVCVAAFVHSRDSLDNQSWAAFTCSTFSPRIAHVDEQGRGSAEIVGSNEA